VEKFPELERGISASETGRDHIPPRVFKEMTRLNRQRELLEEALAGINPFNAKAKAAEVSKILEKYILNVEKMDTLMKKYGTAFKAIKIENRALTGENERLSQELKSSEGQSILKKM